MGKMTALQALQTARRRTISQQTGVLQLQGIYFYKTHTSMTTGLQEELVKSSLKVASLKFGRAKIMLMLMASECDLDK